MVGKRKTWSKEDAAILQTYLDNHPNATATECKNNLFPGKDPLMWSRQAIQSKMQSILRKSKYGKEDEEYEEVEDIQPDPLPKKRKPDVPPTTKIIPKIAPPTVDAPKIVSQTVVAPVVTPVEYGFSLNPERMVKQKEEESKSMKSLYHHVIEAPDAIFVVWTRAVGDEFQVSLDLKPGEFRIYCKKTIHIKYAAISQELGANSLENVSSPADVMYHVDIASHWNVHTYSKIDTEHFYGVRFKKSEMRYVKL